MEDAQSCAITAKGTTRLGKQTRNPLSGVGIYQEEAYDAAMQRLGCIFVITLIPREPAEQQQ